MELARVEVALAFVASSIAPLRAIFFARATARDARSEAMVVVSPAVVATSAVASSASDARAPLIVLPEAAAFPPDFSAPWSRVVAPDARDDAAAAPASPAPAKPPLAVAGATAACRVAALPAPLIPLGGADAALHPRARDVDAEVGAHPDTLRALGAGAGDLVEIRCASANRTRVGRLVAAERWRTPDDDGARGEESDGDDASDGDGHDGHSGSSARARLAPGALYLSPAMRRRLDLHVRLAAVFARGGDRVATPAPKNEEGPGDRGGGADGGACEVTIRILRTAPARAATLAVAPARAPAPLVPTAATTQLCGDPMAPGGAVEHALAEHFRRAPRVLAPGDEFAVVAEASRDPMTRGAQSEDEGPEGEGPEGEGPEDEGPGDEGREAENSDSSSNSSSNSVFSSSSSRPVAYRFVVVRVGGAKEDGASSGGGAAGDSSFLACREWTTCAMLPAVAAGAWAPGLEPFALACAAGGSPRGANPRRRRRPLGKNRRRKNTNANASPSPRPRPPPSSLGFDVSGRNARSVLAALAPPFHAETSRLANLRTAVLLHGPAGAGKRAAAASAASALGASFARWSCHELVATSGGPATTLCAVARHSSFVHRAINAPVLTTAVAPPRPGASTHSAPSNSPPAAPPT